jgi:hypothetical protein
MIPLNLKEMIYFFSSGSTRNASDCIDEYCIKPAGIPTQRGKKKAHVPSAHFIEYTEGIILEMSWS